MGSTNKEKASMLNKQFKSVFTVESEGKAPKNSYTRTNVV